MHGSFFDIHTPSGPAGSSRRNSRRSGGQFDTQNIPAALTKKALHTGGALQLLSFDKRLSTRTRKPFPASFSERDRDSGVRREPYLPDGLTTCDLTARPVRPSVADSVCLPDDFDCHLPGPDPQQRPNNQAIGQAAFDPLGKIRATATEVASRKATASSVQSSATRRVVTPASQLSSHGSPATDTEHPSINSPTGARRTKVPGEAPPV